MKKLNLLLAILFLNTVNVYGMDITDYLANIGSDSKYNKTKLSALEIQQIKSNVEEIYNVAVEGSENVYNGHAPADLREDYHDIAYTLYNDGFLKLEYFEQFEREYSLLLKTTVPADMKPQDFWRSKYISLFDKLLNNMQRNPETCANPNENATVRKCCQGLAKLSVTKQKGSSFINFNKKSSGEQCELQSDCQSNLCVKSDLDKPGICVTPKACFELQTLNGDCSGNKPVCSEGRCIKVDKGNLGIGECRATTNSCTQNSECCSEKCSNNKCVDSFKCLNCVSSGAKPLKGETCCPGTYLAPSGKCRIIFRPLVPVVPTPKSSFFKLILNNIFISSAIADSTDVCAGREALTEAQRSMIDSRALKCREKYKSDGAKLADCMRSVDDLQTGFCLDSKKTVTNVDQSEIDAKRAACVQSFSQNSDKLKQCLDSVTALENANQEAGADSQENRYAEFKAQYNMPAVTAKTYSDVRKCEFQSFNDNWKASSNTERNAEVFLRSFEFTFAGSGTQDYWEDKGKGNIFKRANKVALALRKNRARLIARTQAIDKEMTCKCVAIFGPSEFEKEKQDYFNQNCAAEAASLRADLGSDIDTSRGEGGKVAGESNIDGTSISDESELDQSRARIEEIDKGALGLSHEKLLIEYLDLRSEAQIDRFVDSESLEDELVELSQFISDTDFEEVWKDKVQDDSLIKGNPSGDSRMLYKWGFKYLGGLLALIIMIVFVAVGGIFAGPLFGLIGVTVSGVAGVAAGSAAGLLAGFLVGALISGFSGKGSPGAFDLKKVTKGKYNLLYKFDGFEKWYVGPKYNNKSSNTETRCEVFAKASTCLKSAYAFNDNEMTYLSSLPASGHFIIDPKVPPFVKPGLISTKGMPVYNKTWVQIMNDTVNDGVAYLKTTKPKGKNKKGYTITKKSFAKRDIMQEALDKKYFIPMGGNVSVKTFDYRKAITEAAFKYAMCKDLSTGDCALEGAGVGESGLGYLFESESEAKEWAEYTYEMHYVYSSVTKDTYMGYPLMGADVYFQAVAYNMKLVGSLAASRAQNYARASNLYQTDWDMRARDYQSLSEAELGELKTAKNLKYGPAFFNAFESLNFSGDTKFAGFDAKIDSTKKNKGFNKSELAALSAGRRQAVRINETISSAKKFDETIGKSDEAKGRLASLSKIGSGLVSSSIGEKLLKGSISKGSNSNALGINSNVDKSLNNDSASDSNSKSGSRSKTSSSGASLGNLGNLGAYGSNGSFSTDNYGSDFDTSNDDDEQRNLSQLRDQGMSAQDADDLISAIGRENNYELGSDADDSIFGVVSRAYKRNYSRVLLRSGDFRKKEAPIKDEVMSGDQEAEIKALLETNP